MRTGRRFLVPLLALSAASPATRPTKTFNSDECGFQLKVPLEWIVPDRPDEGQVFTVWMPLHRSTSRPSAGPVDKLQVGGVGLRVEQGPPGMSDFQILRDLSGTMADQLFHEADKGIHHVTVRPAVIGTIPARQVGFVVDHPGGPVAVLYVVGVHKGTEYVFNTAAPADQFDALLPDVKAMLASFDLRE
jgi:hypothetical protein